MTMIMEVLRYIGLVVLLCAGFATGLYAVSLLATILKGGKR